MLGAAISAGKAMRSLDEAKVKYVEVSHYTKTKDGAYSIWIEESGDVAIMVSDEGADGLGKIIIHTDPELIIERFPELTIENIRADPPLTQFAQTVEPFDGHDRDMADKIALDSKWHNRLKKRLLRLVAAILKLN